MQIRPVVSFYHDCRRALKNGKYPVKIRATFEVLRLGKLEWIPRYAKTNVSLSPEEFQAVFSVKVPIKLQKTRQRLLDREREINHIIDQNPNITPLLFDSLSSGKAGIISKRGQDSFPVSVDVEVLFDHFISEYDKAGKIGTRNTYIHAKNSLLAFGGPGLRLDHINKEWLDEYVKWAQVPRKHPNNKKLVSCSITTIGIYLRNLRHIFNEVIDSSRRILPIEKYPFYNNHNRTGYVIRGTETVKQVVNESQRVKLFNTADLSAEKLMALKYWMFWYYCNGMNATDCAYLRPENILEDKIVYVRRKTMRTVKVIKPISVPIRDEVKKILVELGTHRPYLFGIIDDTMSPLEQHNKIKAWYKWVNKHMSEIGEDVGIPFRITSYGARHAVGKQLIKKKVSLQDIQQIYGHTKVSTTQKYTMGMDDEEAKEINNLL
jgi:integrase/recombinase XerD